MGTKNATVNPLRTEINTKMEEEIPRIFVLCNMDQQTQAPASKESTHKEFP